MATRYVTPPILVPEKYASWRKEMVIWEMATNLDKDKMAPNVFLFLPETAKKAILEIDPKELNKNDGLTKMYTKLDTLYKEDETQAALICYDKFERYSRPQEMTINNYLIEFERMVAQLKIHKIVLPEPVLAYRALRSANLSDESYL